MVIKYIHSIQREIPNQKRLLEDSRGFRSGLTEIPIESVLISYQTLGNHREKLLLWRSSHGRVGIESEDIVSCRDKWAEEDPKQNQQDQVQAGKASKWSAQ